eukprot:6185933-Pleurochrysis_carterae.AAC.1
MKLWQTQRERADANASERTQREGERPKRTRRRFQRRGTARGGRGGGSRGGVEVERGRKLETKGSGWEIEIPRLRLS